jgi:hypothetical protein
MSISYSLILFLAIISKGLLILGSTYHISYLNKIIIISKNKTQDLHAIESPLSKIFFIVDSFKSFRQTIGGFKRDCYFPKETEYTCFKEIDS